MLFDYLKAITVNKDPNLPLDEYSQFLMNRWISFMSPSISNLINNTLNQLGNIDKDIHYKLMLSMIPKSKYFKKISYIKKGKKLEEDDIEYIEKYATYNEISTREVKTMKEMADKMKL